MGEVLIAAEALVGGTPEDLPKPPAGILTVTEKAAKWGVNHSDLDPAAIGRAANNLIARNENVSRDTVVDVAAFSSRI